MRWGIFAGAAVVGTLSLGLLGFWTAATSADDAPDWRTRDLLFLKSAHDRLKADMERGSAGNTVAASLLREQQALLAAMAAVAKPMATDAIPDMVRPLLPPAAPAPIVELAVEAPAPPPAMAPPAELRPGLSGLPPALDLAGLAFDPGLRAPLARRAVAAKPPAPEKPAAATTPKPIKSAAIVP